MLPHAKINFHVVVDGSHSATIKNIRIGKISWFHFVQERVEFVREVAFKKICMNFVRLGPRTIVITTPGKDG